MKSIKILTIIVLALGLFVCLPKAGRAEPIGTAFTYQGRLLDANTAADGLYDLQFTLYDAVSDGNAVGFNVRPDVDVIDGYFTTVLDFNSVFDGNARWLEIDVRPGNLNDPNVYTVLSPRLRITPTPYALYSAGGGGGADSDWIISGNNMYSGVSGNVGIGTGSSPDHKQLEVNGTIKTAVICEEYTYTWTWTAKESNRGWQSVAMSADGTKQTAVVRGGQIYVSTDSGNIWTAKESNRNWFSVAMSADGTKQTAVVYPGQIYVSTDSGNTWTAKESSRYWMSVAMSADGTKQTAVAFYGEQIYISTDSGNTWTPKESNRYWQSVAMSADGTKQTAVVWGGQIYVSTDSGNTWTAKESNRNWQSVAMSADGTKQTAVVNGGQIYVSTDSGNTWTPKESNRSWYSVAMSADATKQTAVVWNGQIYVYINYIGVGIGTTTPAGKLDVNGSIYQRGTVLHADYVFEPGYKLESIDEHSEFMWQEKHLPAMPKIQKDENGREIVEIGARSRGIVEELEKAHIYIEQLNKENKELRAKLTILDARLDTMESLVTKLSQQEGGIK